ncbi:nitrogen permease regulator of amino acid transport activity 3-domain-containing protein [Fomes fomentarius]|nr:nitrogen permease regulator of amino acid transport activity 3-domain-containing protein [Fomes fomentarius]
MSQTVLCILLVTSSAKGSNLVYHWPPSPHPIPRLARPLPTNDFPGSFADNPWRAANSPDNPAEQPQWDASPSAAQETDYDDDDDDLAGYYWQRPSGGRRHRSVSFTHHHQHHHHPPSHPTSRRASPSKDGKGLGADDASHLGVGVGVGGGIGEGGSGESGDGDEYDTLLGYSGEFLAQILCPNSSMCHQKFELVVDDLAFIGHPVCADADGGWRFRQTAKADEEGAKTAAVRGRGSKKAQSNTQSQSQSPSDVSGDEGRNGTDTLETETERMTDRAGEQRGGGRGEGRALPVLQTGDSGIKTFHFVVVLDLPDPSSSASGNIAKYFDTVYQQIAFNVTAVLYQEQVLHQYVEAECDKLGLLKEEYANKGERYDDFMFKAVEISSLAAAMQALYQSIERNDIARITLHDLSLEIQLPPYLDSLLYADEDVEPEEEVDDHDGEPNPWGPEMSFAWRLPALTPWKALLRLNHSSANASDDDEQGYDLEMQLQAAQINPEERDLAEQLLRFLDLASVTLSLAEMASLLDWHLESQVYPAVRWLVLHRRAKIVDVVHPSLKTVFSVPQKFSSPLAALSAEFADRFSEAGGVPPLPKLLALISTATQTHKQSTNQHFYATVVHSKELIPLYSDVVLWMLRRDLLIRLHLRIRIIATEALKKRVRQRWEEHAMRKRSRSRARKIGRGRERGATTDSFDRGRGRRGDVDVDMGMHGAADMDDKAGGPVLETVSESSPVEYWVSLSPKTARKQARSQRALDDDGGDVTRDEKGKGEGEDGRGREKGEEVDEELFSSSADEAKWEEYYQNGGNDNIASMISDPARATPLERRWLAGMSEGRDPHIVRRFERIHQYFDGKCSDDEILYRAEISRKQLREVLHHYEEYLQTFLHPS